MQVICGACGRTTVVVDAMRGRQFQCPACRQLVLVPAAEPEALAPLPLYETEPTPPVAGGRSHRRLQLVAVVIGALLLAGAGAAFLLLRSPTGVAEEAFDPEAVQLPTTPPPEPTGSPRKVAVLVGIENYRQTELPPLQYAEDDARELAAVFQALGYEVRQLGDEAGRADGALRPLRKNIVAAIHAAVQGVTPNDTLVIGLIGHGVHFDSAKGAFFCPLDADPSPAAIKTLLSFKSLYDILERSPAGQKVLLVDAARTDPALTGGVSVTDAPPPPGVAAIFSCSSGEASHEFAALQHGVFAHCVLAGLRGKAVDATGAVTFESLATYVRNETPLETVRHLNDQTQTPTFAAVKPIVLATGEELARVPPVAAESSAP